MTTFLLIRHGDVPGVHDRLNGRLPIRLSDVGCVQARRLATRVQREPVTAIYSSPTRRAAETAEIMAGVLRLPVCVDEALEEVDFGRWTGRSFEELASDSQWRAFNNRRTLSSVGGGDTMVAVQARIVGWIAAMAASQEDATIVGVSHADVIRAALAGCAGMSLELSLRLDVAPASISEVAVGDEVRIRRINDTAHLEDAG